MFEAIRVCSAHPDRRNDHETGRCSVSTARFPVRARVKARQLCALISENRSCGELSVLPKFAHSAVWIVSTALTIATCSISEPLPRARPLCRDKAGG